MRRLLPLCCTALTLVVALLTGCSSSSDASAAIDGIWGGTDLRIAAGGDSMQVRLPCMAFVTRGAIDLKDDGIFQFVATNEGMGNLPAGAYSIALTGRISGQLMQVSYLLGITNVAPGSSVDVQLIRGQQGSIDELCAN
jgi:hypothetical protein